MYFCPLVSVKFNAYHKIFSEHACDSLSINSDSDNTKLLLHQFSSDIIFDTPLGYTGDNLECNPSNVYIIVDSNLSEISSNLPCQDVTFKCNKSESCSME